MAGHSDRIPECPAFFVYDMNKVLWFVFSKNGILLQKSPCDSSYGIPAEELPFNHIAETGHITHFCGDVEARAFMVEEPVSAPVGYIFVPLRKTYFFLPEEIYSLACKMEELVYWNNETHYCGRCGGKMVFSSPISKRCADCGHEVWPVLQLAVIVLVRREDKVLLVQSKSFKSDYMGLVAGFVETGETLEQAVHREVMEETQIRIKNLRYIKSQVWPFPCNLMAGFVADYESGVISIQKSELNKGGWFARDEMPPLPDEASIARQIINAWIRGEI